MDRYALHRWRKERKMNQATLAKNLGVSARTISAWENGAQMPRDIVEQLEVVSLRVRDSGRLLQDDAALVSPKTAARLYIFRKGMLEPKAIHPIKLFPGRWEDAAVPLSFLVTDEYLEAVKVFEAASEAERTEENRLAVERVMADPPANLPHAPGCRCPYCRVTKRFI